VYLRFIPSYPEEPAEVFLALLGSHETLNYRKTPTVNTTHTGLVIGKTIHLQKHL
jgi:hypothetical protein